MPCHPARARELVRKGRAVRRFRKGFFYIQLLDREVGVVQPVACGIDPGSKWEGFTVKSEKRTFANIHADAVTHVKEAVEVRREMRRGRRYREDSLPEATAQPSHRWDPAFNEGQVGMEGQTGFVPG